MHRLLSIATLIVATCIAYNGAARSQAATDTDQVEQLLAHTPILTLTDAIASELRVGVPNALFRTGLHITDSESRKVRKALAEAYSTTSIREDFLRRVAIRLALEHRRALDGWYTSPLGRELKRNEEWALEREWSPTQVRRSAAELLAKASQERSRLLHDLGRLVPRATLSQVSYFISRVAMLRINVALLPNEPAISEGDLRDQLKRERPELQSAVFAHMTDLGTNAYLGIITANLAKYADFLQSEEMRFVDAAISSALTETLEDATNRLSVLLAKELASPSKT